MTLTGVPTWIAEGPAPNTGNGNEENIPAETGGAPNAVSGGLEAMAVDPGNSNEVFVGGVNGGAWMTTNITANPVAWTPMTDQFPSLEISSLQFDPTDSTDQTVVAGLGNTSNIRTNLGPVTGLLKTTNGGTTWTDLGNTSVMGLLGDNVSAVLPRGNTILVGVVSGSAPGMYRSTDDGATFQLISGTNNLSNGPVYDVEPDPSDVNRAYVVVGGPTGGVFRTDNLGASWVNITDSATTPAIAALLMSGTLSNARLAISAASPYPVYLAIADNGRLGGNPMSGVFRSADMGGSWATEDLPQTLDAPRTIMSISNTTPIVVTTTVANNGYSTNERVQISGSTDPGANGDWTISVNSATPNQFTLLNSMADGGGSGGTANDIQGINGGGQAFPNLTLAADPSNNELVYIAGDTQIFTGSDSSVGNFTTSARIFRGNFAVAPGGPTAVPSPQWTPLTDVGTSNGSAPHSDSRAMVIDNGELIYTCDGGIFEETSPTNASGQWLSLNGAPTATTNGIQVAQFFGISYDSLSNIIFGGAQDVGTPQQSSPQNQVYDDQTSSDGPGTAVDDLTSTTQSIRYIGGTRYFYNASNTNVGTNIPLFPAGGVNGTFFNFTAVAVSDVAPPAGQSARVVIVNGNGASNAQMTGNPGTAIFESTNAGIAATTAAIVYTQIPTGTGWAGVNDFVTGRYPAISVGGTLSGVANQYVLYACSGNQVFLRTTAGGTLTATAGQPAFAGTLYSIAVDPDNWMTAYVSDNTNVFETTNAGASWTNVTGNLRDNNIHSILVVDGTGSNAGITAVVVGETDGDFRMLSTDPNVWTKYGLNFPNSSVWGTQFSQSNNVLVAATSGRGAFEVQNASATLFTAGILTIDGDQDYPNENDTIELILDPANPLILDVYLNSTSPVFTVPIAVVQQINVNGLGGNNTLIVDSSNGLINVPNGIFYDGGTGGDNTLDLLQTGGPTQTSDTYTVITNPGQGSDVIVGASRHPVRLLPEPGAGLRQRSRSAHRRRYSLE